MWVDSDTFVNCPKIPLSDIIDHTKSIHLGINCVKEEIFKDLLFKKTLNAGVFIIKNDSIGRSYLEDCIKTFKTRKVCNVNGKPESVGSFAGKCYEQGIMNELIRGVPKYTNATQMFNPGTIYNGTETHHTSPVIIHLYGRDKQKAAEYFEKLIDKNRQET